jgi:L-threonylcarbamoyladenylate synthase
MKKLKIDLENYTKEDIAAIVASLKRGEVIAYPTDTVYGLGCIATNRTAVKRIHNIKRRDSGKPLLVLIKSFSMLNDLCNITAKQEKYISSIWPVIEKEGEKSGALKRPTTFILRSKGVLPQEILGAAGSLALRLPRNKFLQAILEKLDAPLVSTSLNISGKKPIENLDEIDNHFTIYKPDFIVDAGHLKKQKPSVIIDIRDMEDIKIVRK